MKYWILILMSLVSSAFASETMDPIPAFQCEDLENPGVIALRWVPESKEMEFHSIHKARYSVSYAQREKRKPEEIGGYRTDPIQMLIFGQQIYSEIGTIYPQGTLELMTSDIHFLLVDHVKGPWLAQALLKAESRNPSKDENLKMWYVLDCRFLD